MLEYHTQEGRVALRLRVLRMGEDVCLLLDGGQRPHMGAVAVVYADEVDQSVVNQKNFSLPHHKEEELATRMARRVQEQYSCTVTCLCGIHIPSITKEEIALVYVKADELVQKFLTEAIG